MFPFMLEASIIFCALWFLCKWLSTASSWDELPGPEKSSLVFGNLLESLSRQAAVWHLAMVKRYGRVFKYHGFFGKKHLYVSDPQAIYHILVKDQNIWELPAAFVESNKLTFGDGLLSIQGERHRKQRKILNPVFSTAHMRSLAPIFYVVTQQLVDSLRARLRGQPQDIDIFDCISRVSLECIGRGALEYSFNVFDKNANNEFANALKEFGTSATSLSPFRYLVPFLVRLGTPRLRRFLYYSIPSRAARSLGNAVDIMHKVSVDIYQLKAKALAEGRVDHAKGIMSVLLEANASAGGESLPETEIIGQMSTLILAARGTTSTSVSRILHLLALHPDEQSKLRKELLEAHSNAGNHELPYDELNSLPLLDAIVKETMRRYPIVSAISRSNRVPTILPLSTPLPNSPESNLIHVPANTEVAVGIAAANRDPIIWGADAEEWKPERWLGKRTEEVAFGDKLPGVYSGMLTFAAGGRSCIGFKFFLLEAKIVLSMLISAFVFEPIEGAVEWQEGVFTFPTLKGKENGLACLPLKVRAVGPDE